MRIIYVLLAPTPGMHQYTGDLAAQMLGAGHEVHVVTTTDALLQRDRYPSEVALHTPVHQRTTGFRREGLHGSELWSAYRCIEALQPHLVHFSGVHLWNPLLLLALRRRGITVVHTLHDLDPHPGVAHASLIRLWNRSVIASAPGIVVHGACYRARLLGSGRSPASVLAVPLLHSFLPLEQHVRLSASLPEPSFAPWALFFGRFQRYKGLEVLLAAQSLLAQKTSGQGVVLAGGGDIDSIWPNPLPQGVTVLNRHIQSEEGWQLFQRCGVLVLPYTGATQSALPAAAYAFGKPVIVTTSGALPEAVQPGVTGWVVPAGNPKALADCLSSVMCDSKLLAAAGAAGRRWYEEARQRQPVELATFYAATIAAHHGPVHDKRIPEL